MPCPVITVARMREWENASWKAGCDQEAVMRRAGRAVAEAALGMTRARDRILVLAGRGNNGGDAKFAAEHLADREVRLVELRDEGAAGAFTFPDENPALIIDALFGIGLNRPLEGGWRELVARLNSRRARVLAVDVPSGLNADTGEPQGDSVRATLTVTFGAMKTGLLNPAAAEFTGRLEVAADIGLIPCPFTFGPQWTLPVDLAGFPLERPANGHKGTFGHLAIVAGSVGYHGAAVLAARGALRAMPGLVSVFTTERAYPAVAAQLAQPMVHPWGEEARLPATTSGILLGPGLAGGDVPESLIKCGQSLWRESPLPVVADASALDWLPEGGTPAGAIRVITPHPGEAGRMLGRATPVEWEERPAAVRDLSRRWGDCWCVLKGRHTLVGRAPNSIFINPSGNPELAQGGSGDVLAGYLAGWLAQPRTHADGSLAIRHAVWEHGRAADVLAGRGDAWGMGELIGQLGSRPGQRASPPRSFT